MPAGRNRLTQENGVPLGGIPFFFGIRPRDAQAWTTGGGQPPSRLAIFRSDE